VRQPAGELLETAAPGCPPSKARPLSLRTTIDLVGAAGFEPATVGLEILPPHPSRPYPSVFSTSSFFPMVHSESFGDDLLRGVGHDFGQHFRDFKRVNSVGQIVTEHERH
jgi:hypothetical protein